MLKNIYTNSLLYISILFIISCDKGEPVAVHEHEVFTRVVQSQKDGEKNYKKYTFEVEAGDHHGHDDHDDHGDEDHDDDHGDEHMEIEFDTNSTYHVGIFSIMIQILTILKM